MKLKEKLLQAGLVQDNEYLDKYVEIVETKSSPIKQVGVHNKHHIIPRFYFRTNKIQIDNSKENISNLEFKYHILAHYYLTLCSVEKYRFMAELSFFRTSGFMTLPNSEHAIGDMDRYDDVYNSYVSNCSRRMTGHIVSEETKRKISISNTGKRRTKEQKEYISKTTKAAMTDEMLQRNIDFHMGSVWVNDGVHSKQVRPEQVEEFLNNGWVKGRPRFSEQTLKNMTIANREIWRRKRRNTGKQQETEMRVEHTAMEI